MEVEKDHRALTPDYENLLQPEFKFYEQHLPPVQNLGSMALYCWMQI